MPENVIKFALNSIENVIKANNVIKYPDWYCNNISTDNVIPYYIIGNLLHFQEGLFFSSKTDHVILDR